MKRKEDPRFIRGRGRYLDDIMLPEHAAISRSCTARIRTRASRASTRARRSPCPASKPSSPAKISKRANLGLDSDLPRLRQADGAGRRQGAVPVSRSRRRRRRRRARSRTTRAELVEVEYEPLDPVADPFEREKDKIILRDDRENKTNHIYHWEVGDSATRPTARWRIRKSRSRSALVPALPSGAARTVRRRRRHEQSHGPAHAST